MISMLDNTHNNSKMFNQLFYNLGSGYSSRMGAHAPITNSDMELIYRGRKDKKSMQLSSLEKSKLNKTQKLLSN